MELIDMTTESPARSTTLQTGLKGSCLCGQVSYSLTQKPSQFYFCHCQQCQKVTGSSFAANIIGPVDSIRWLSGEDSLTHFDHPSRAFSKTFCSLCGSGVPHINKSKTSLVIPAGSLDQAPVMEPTSNIFMSESPEWLSIGLSANKFTGYADEKSSEDEK
jgi:hypothetical protein